MPPLPLPSYRRLVIFHGACLPLSVGKTHLGEGFTAAIRIQRFHPDQTSLLSSATGVTTGSQGGLFHLRSSRTKETNPPSIFLRPPQIGTELSRDVLNPSSRTALIGRTAAPLGASTPPEIAMNRHRGAKPERRCELLTPISFLSPAYLLSVERWPFHTEPPDHYVLLSAPA